MNDAVEEYDGTTAVVRTEALDALRNGDIAACLLSSVSALAWKSS